MPISQALFDSLEKSGGLVPEKPSTPSGGSGDGTFFEQASPIADRISQNIGVSPRVVAALMALETGHGKSVIPGTNNWGNIKDFSGKGVSAKDNMTGTRDKYRAYGSGEEFADDFSNLMKRKYPDAVGVGDDARAFVDALRRGGYAEDPAHGQKIIKIADGLKGRFGGGSSSGTKWADDKAVPRDDGRPGAQSKSEAYRQGPTVGDAVKTFGASAVSGIGDMAQGLIGEPMAWLANKAAGTEEFEGKNLLAGVADSIRDGMTEGGKLAREDAPTGDVFQPDTWKLPETTGGMLMIGADGLGSLIPSIVPFAGQAGRAASLAKAAKAAELAGDAQKASQLAMQAERASRTAKTAGAAGGFGMTGGAAASEVRQNVERELQDRTHEDLVKTVPLYLEAFARTGDAKMARQAVINGAAQYATLFSGAMGAVGGGVNAALLEDVIVKRGVSAAVGRLAGSKAVRGAVGASAGAVGEGMQEVSEKVGQNAGENAGLGRPIANDVTRDSFGDFVGGAMVGGPVGGLGGGASVSAPVSANASPAQPTIKPNSPLSNAAGIAQAEQANAAAQSNLAIQQQALAEQEATSSGGAPAVDPSAAAQDAIRRRLVAAQRESAPQQDYSSAAEDAENEIGQATGLDQQEQILEFNRLLAEEQASLAEQRGDIAEAQRIRSAEMASREAIRASRARNGVGKPSGSFGQMNEFAGLLSEERADIEERRADAASRRNLQAESELQAADARVFAQMARESASRRRAVLDAILADPGTENPAARFSAELNRQGFLDSSPTQDELAAIQRFDDLKAADFQPDVEPAAPNEADFYEPPKQAAKPVGKRFITPADIRRMVADGANLSKDTLTLPDGSTVRLKGPHIAAARKAISDRRKAQDGTQPGTPNAEVASEAPEERGSVVSGSAGNAPADSEGRPEGRDGANATITEPGLRADRADGDGRLVDVAQPEIRSAIDAAAHEAATSPLNDTPQPTDAQKEAGNYKVGRIRIQGMEISIENPKGSKRSGVSPDGVRWESTMANHYGYFPGTKAADGDNLDVFVTDGAEDAPSIFIIDQRNQDGSFDEHKAVFGPRTEEEARTAYLANYEPGWTGLGAISSMPVDAFKSWAFDGKKKRKPLAYVVPEVTATEEDSASADPREAYADEKERAYIAKRGGVAPPKAAMAVRVGAYREYDRKQAELARPNPLDVPSAEVTRASDETVDALSEDEAKAVVVRLGKKPGKDPYATIKAEHPDDIARAISGDTWSAGRWIPAQQPIRGESAANQEPVKNEPPANTGDSADRDAGNQEPIKNAEPSPLDFTPKQYHEARMKWVAQEYGLSNAEVRQDYDTDAARKADDDAWVAAVRQAFKEGRDVPRSTLDKLEELRPGAFGSFLHDHPDAKVPAGYQTPDARATEKASADAKKDARSDVAQPSDLASIFTGLASRGLAKSRAKKAAEAHPRAAQIAYVQDNFHDILTELEDKGLVKINCD